MCRAPAASGRSSTCVTSIANSHSTVTMSTSIHAFPVFETSSDMVRVFSELEMDERAAKARVRARFNAATFQETLMTSSVVRAELALLVKKIVSGFLVAIPVRSSRSSCHLAADRQGLWHRTLRLSRDSRARRRVDRVLEVVAVGVHAPDRQRWPSPCRLPAEPHAYARGTHQSLPRR